MIPQQLISPLRRVLAQPNAGGSSDGQLLERFVHHRDESAFELLVWRHGPMVLGVCRRILDNAADAEDAFQATLLVLARKAGAIGNSASVASWLYKVAYRVALRARSAALRRACHERQVPQLPPVADPHTAALAPVDDLRQVLDEELNRLAEKYRAAVVLCYLEGLTNEEAARQLRCPVGTIKTRLAHARQLLGKRLARRGLALGTWVLGAESLLSASPPTALVGTVVRALGQEGTGTVALSCAVSPSVISLMEGVLRAMMLTKVKMAGVLLTVGLLIAGAGTASYRALADEPASENQEAQQEPPKSTPAEKRVKQLKQQLTELTRELHRAEDEAAREKAVPPHKRPVAVIFGNVHITRDELADYLFSRMTAEQLEKYINRRILEHACSKAGITVGAEEVDAYAKEILAKTNLDERAFLTNLGNRYATLREWKEDAIRTQLLLKKLAGAKQLSEQALRKAYEARYGKRVECRILVLPSVQREEAEQTVRRLRTGITNIDQEGTRVPTIRVSPPKVIARHSTQSEAIEKAAFGLKAGQFSDVIALPEGFVILQCVRHLPASKGVRFEDVRQNLEREEQTRIEQRDLAAFFNKLKTEARARLLWTPPR